MFRVLIIVGILFSVALPASVLGQSAAPPDVAPGDSQNAFDRAVSAQKAGDYEEALRAIGNAQRLEPKNGQFIWRRVLILHDMGESALAENVLREQRETILESVDVEEVEAFEATLASEVGSEGNRASARVEQTDRVDEEEPPRPTRAPGFVLTGIGMTFVSTAAVLFLVASSDEHRLDCSTQLRDDCDGVSLIDDLDRPEIDRRSDRITSLRTAGWVAAGVSIALLGWGIWELLTFDDSSNHSARFVPLLGANSVGAAIEFTVW